MKEFAVLIERTSNGYSAHVPDLPGCVAGGDTLEETLELMKGAIDMHLEDMVLTGQPVPDPTTIAVQIKAA